MRKSTIRLLLAGLVGVGVSTAMAQESPPVSADAPVVEPAQTNPPATQPAQVPAAAIAPADVADPAVPPPAAPMVANPDEWIDLNLPDQIELRELVDSVSGYLKINILFDEQIDGKTVTIRTPSRITRQGLLGLLDSALQLKQMAVVGAGPGLMKVVPLANNLSSYAASGGVDGGQVGAVTRVFNLEHADATRVAEVIRPFLNQQAGGNALPVLGTRQLVVSDFAATVERIEVIIKWIDEGDPNIVTRMIPLTQAKAKDLVNTVQQALRDNDKARFGGTGESISVAADERTNQLVIIGPKGILADTESIIADLDRPLPLTTRVYRLQTVSAEQVKGLFQDLLGDSADPQNFRAGVSTDTGALVVTATEAIHEQIASLVKELDSPAQESPIQFYKLKNTIAADVLQTIAGLTEQAEGFAMEGARASANAAVAGAAASSANAAIGQTAGQTAGSPASPAPAIAAGEAMSAVQPLLPGVGLQNRAALEGRSDWDSLDRRTSGGVPSRDIYDPSIDYRYGGSVLSRDRMRVRPNVQAVRGGGVIVTADVNTNSIIVVAPPQQQRVYAELIRQLDRRRPQVQIECTIVSIDTSKGFVLGVELASVGGVGDEGKIITFTSFGLSEIVDGQPSPIPGNGLNFALLSPDVASIVLRALSTNGRSRTVSMPSVLVNDNETGRLQSKNKVPFIELVDRSDGTSSTTVGGAVEAGTMVSVTPHISENDYLQLDYEIELSSFSGLSEPGLPPPTLVNRVDSSVTIPDGYTIVVGGLSVKSITQAVSGIPYLKDIPGLGLLFSSRANNTTDTTLFVFIRPAILRDEQFRDLRFYSGRAQENAELPGDYPESSPLPVR